MMKTPRSLHCKNELFGNSALRLWGFLPLLAIATLVIWFTVGHRLAAKTIVVTGTVRFVVDGSKPLDLNELRTRYPGRLDEYGRLIPRTTEGPEHNQLEDGYGSWSERVAFRDDTRNIQYRQVELASPHGRVTKWIPQRILNGTFELGRAAHWLLHDHDYYDETPQYVRDVGTFNDRDVRNANGITPAWLFPNQELPFIWSLGTFVLLGFWFLGITPYHWVMARRGILAENERDYAHYEKVRSFVESTRPHDVQPHEPSIITGIPVEFERFAGGTMRFRHGRGGLDGHFIADPSRIAANLWLRLPDGRDVRAICPSEDEIRRQFVEQLQQWGRMYDTPVAQDTHLGGFLVEYEFAPTRPLADPVVAAIKGDQHLQLSERRSVSVHGIESDGVILVTGLAMDDGTGTGQGITQTIVPTGFRRMLVSEIMKITGTVVTVPEPLKLLEVQREEPAAARSAVA